MLRAACNMQHAPFNIQVLEARQVDPKVAECESALYVLQRSATCCNAAQHVVAYRRYSLRLRQLELHHQLADATGKRAATYAIIRSPYDSCLRHAEAACLSTYANGIDCGSEPRELTALALRRDEWMASRAEATVPDAVRRKVLFRLQAMHLS